MEGFATEIIGAITEWLNFYRNVDPRIMAFAVSTVVTVVVLLYFYKTLVSNRRTEVNEDSMSSSQRSKEANDMSKRYGRYRPVVSITLNNIVLNLNTLDQYHEGLQSLFQEALTPLKELCCVSDVYLITTVENDIQEEKIRDTINLLRSFGYNISNHGILFCSTTEGRVPMIRQLQPHVHLDHDATVTDMLKGIIPNIVQVKSPSVSNAQDSSSAITLRKFVDSFVGT